MILIPIFSLAILILLSMSAFILCLTDWFTNNLKIRKNIIYLCITWIGIAAFLSIYSFINVGINHNIYYINYYQPWIEISVFQIDWEFLIDSLSVTMFIVVLPTSFLIHIYAIEYMCYDKNITRFIGYLSLFTLMMFILISAANLIQMFLGWEGIGLASYLLINYWYTREQANKSSIKAIIINRIGDLCLIIAIALIFQQTGTTNYHLIFANLPTSNLFITINSYLNFRILDIITFLILIGAMAKSAQLFLHTWLADAMEGPTPVSALIHAATLVTAGVFLIIRLSPLYEFTPNIRFLIIFIGSVTCVYASIVALSQNDLKRIIAFSTCSQLGYMFLACGLSNYTFALFHLLNHAYFKALLFLSAGSIIHALNGEQDIRKMGVSPKYLPITSITMFIAVIALIGLPFFSGYYSKHAIIETTLISNNSLSLTSFIFSVISAFFTALYNIRLLYYVFYIEQTCSIVKFNNIKESSISMLIPMICLSIMSILSGYIFKDIFIGIGTNFGNDNILVLTENYTIVLSEFLKTLIQIVINLIILTGIISGILIYGYNFEKFCYVQLNHKIFLIIQHFNTKKWYFDIIYNKIILINLFKFAYIFIYQFLDRGILLYLITSGLLKVFPIFTKFIHKYQTGSIFNYIYIHLISILCFIIFLI